MQLTPSCYFSPNSVASEIRTLEIKHGVKPNKRLVPVVWKGVDDNQVDSTLLADNWIFLRQEDDFKANFEPNRTVFRNRKSYSGSGCETR